MNRRRMKVLGLLFLGFFLLTACGSQGNAGKPPSKKGLKIVTSFYPIYALVKEISGDQNDIWMVQSGAGIHDYEPSTKEVAQIYDADVFVYHSQTLGRSLRSQSSRFQVASDRRQPRNDP